MSYSILMTVYDKESPRHLEQAILSMLNQTVPCDDFVIVCDGPLNEGLDHVLEAYADKLRVIRLEKNVGTSKAANIGLKECKHELVARMDSDDISLPDRCEKELKIFEEHPEYAIVGGVIQEFIGDPDEEGLLKKRVLPEYHEEIVRFSKRRSPFNQPAVMMKKSYALDVGGYPSEYISRFEDYDLWVRMLQNGAIGYNIQEVLVYMRTSEDFYVRRGGLQNAKYTLHIHKKMIRSGWCGKSSFITCAVPHAMVCLMPNFTRKVLYKMLRK